MIKITTDTGTEMWINPRHIVNVFKVGKWGREDAGKTRLITSDMRGSDEYWNVTESVEHLINAINHEAH